MSNDTVSFNFAFYGIAMIILGIITFMVTYKKVAPTGSIYLILGGMFVLLMRRYGRNKN